MPRPALRSRWWLAAAILIVAAGAIAAWIALGADDAAPRAPPGEAVHPDARPAGSTTGSGDRAARLVDEAMAAVAAGNVPQARDRLAEAYALDPRPATLLALATVEFQTGRCREAQRAAQGVIAAVPGSPLADTARALLGQIGRCD